MMGTRVPDLLWGNRVTKGVNTTGATKTNARRARVETTNVEAKTTKETVADAETAMEARNQLTHQGRTESVGER